MLEKLEDLDWGRLSHAYGDASDVPGLIRALASDDGGVRDEALHALFGNVWHQGTVYEATAFAVPFLVELLADPSVRGKDGILHLLACLAEGHSYIDVHAHLIDGIGVGPASGQERAERETMLGLELGWVRAAREAVEAGAATYLVMLTDDDPDLRVMAAFTLARCAGRADRFVPRLAAVAAAEPDDRARASMVLGLAALGAAGGGRDGVHRLLAGLIGPAQGPVVRLAAAIGLARWNPGEPPPKVLSALAESTGPAWAEFEGLPWCDGDVAETVAEALAGRPEAQLRVLLGLLDDGDAKVRGGARYALENLCRRRRSVTPLVAEAVGSRVLGGDPDDRREAARLLAHLGPEAAPAAGPLAAALGDHDLRVRTHAAVALAGLRDPHAIPALVALLDHDLAVPEATKALDWFGPAARDAVPALLAVLGREPPTDRLLAHNRPIQVASAFAAIGPEARGAVPALISLMKGSPHTTRAVVNALGLIGGPEARAAVPALRRLLCSPEENVRTRAALALWRLDRDAGAVLPVLIEQLRPGGKDRSHAAEALEEIGAAARPAVPELRACLDSAGYGSMWVRLHAARALWRVDRRADWSLPVLVGLLGDPGAVGALVATLAAEGLGEMGPLAREAAPVLRAAVAGDERRFGGAVDEIITRDAEFRSAVDEALRRIEGET